MDRRHFLKRSVASAAGIATTGVVATDASAKTVKVKTRLEYGQTIKEPSRRIPVVDSADLIVVGGGPAGFAASVAAARQGLDAGSGKTTVIVNRIASLIKYGNAYNSEKIFTGFIDDPEALLRRYLDGDTSVYEEIKGCPCCTEWYNYMGYC